MKKMVCCTCGRVFTLGVDGVVGDGLSVCDSCAGVERDKNGYAWLPGEKESTFQDVATGKEFTISRQEAFSHPY